MTKKFEFDEGDYAYENQQDSLCPICNSSLLLSGRYS